MWGLLSLYPLFLIQTPSWHWKEEGIHFWGKHSPTRLKISFVFMATKAQRNPFFRSLYEVDMNLGTKADQNVISTGALG